MLASQGNSQANIPSTVGELSTISFNEVVVPISCFSKTVFDFTGTFRSVAGSTSMLVGKKVYILYTYNFFFWLRLSHAYQQDVWTCPSLSRLCMTLRKEAF